MQCETCNHINREGAAFCVKCGAKLIAKPKQEKIKDDSKKLAYIVSENELVDENILKDTVDIKISEMVPYISTKVMGKRCFKYNIIKVSTIREVISKQIKKDDFLSLFLNLLNSILGLQGRGIKLNNLFLDMDHIYVECTSLTVNLVCIPISNRNQDTSLEALLKEIILKAEFNYNENCKYVKDLLGYFDENELIDIAVLQGIIGDLLEENTPISSESQNSQVASTDIKEGSSIKESIQENNSYRSVEYDEDDNESTTLLFEDDNESTTLLSPEVQKTYYPYLIRKKNDEKIIINKKSYKIGKDRNGADYFVADNPAVSRIHAEIITQNGEYYIVDKGSTNHTFVNNEMIPSNKEIKIAHETEIRLGNEEFEFGTI